MDFSIFIKIEYMFSFFYLKVQTTMEKLMAKNDELQTHKL
jgi:hypothetical protein